MITETGMIVHTFKQLLFFYSELSKANTHIIDKLYKYPSGLARFWYR